MAERVLSLEEVKRRPIEEVLQEVIEDGETLTVCLPGGREIMIAPKPRLRPLPTLDGSVPEGWKDALYASR